MDANLLNPFISSLDNTIAMFCGSHIKKEKIELSKNPVNHGTEVHVFLGITGDLYGTVFLSADRKNSLRMASMMVGSKLEEFDDVSASALQELLNITSGSAVTQLAQKGINADISPPSFLTGKELNLHVAAPFISILFSIKDIKFYMNLSIENRN